MEHLVKVQYAISNRCSVNFQVCGRQNNLGNIQAVPLGTCTAHQPCDATGMFFSTYANINNENTKNTLAKLHFLI